MDSPTPFRQRLARNTAASIATNVWTMALTFVTLPILLGGLGTDAFGVWAFLLTLSATTGWLSISTVGLGVASTRRVAAAVATDDAAARSRAVGTALATSTVVGLVAGAAVAAFGSVLVTEALDLQGAIVDEVRVVACLFGVQVFVEHVFSALLAVLDGYQDVALARGIDAVRKTAVAATTAVAAIVSGDLVGVGAASLTATVAGALVAGVVVHRAGGLALRASSGPDAIALARYAVTVSALTATGVVHRTMDRTIAGFAFGAEAVVLVEIANQIQVGATALLSATTYPVNATAAWLHSRGDLDALRALLARTTRYSVLLTYPLVAIVIVLAGPFVRLWVGDEYAEAIGLVQVAVAYVAVAAPLQASSNLLQGCGAAGAVLRAALASVMVNLAMSLLLIQVIGLVGVFVATIIGAAVLVPLLATATRATTGQPLRPVIVSALACAAPPAAGAALGGLIGLAAADEPLAQLVIGLTAGGLLALVATMRWSLAVGERRDLLAALWPRPNASL